MIKKYGIYTTEENVYFIAAIGYNETICGFKFPMYLFTEISNKYLNKWLVANWSILKYESTFSMKMEKTLNSNFAYMGMIEEGMRDYIEDKWETEVKEKFRTMIGKFNTSNVTNMSEMFKNCKL